MSLRSSYLKSHWPSYPLLDKSQIALAGRIKKIDLEHQIYSLLVDQKNTQNTRDVQIPKQLKLPTMQSDSAHYYAQEVLREGDLIGLQLQIKTNTALKVQLLAPCLSQRITTGFDVSTSRQWQDFLADIRAFFVAQKFIEVQTPYLVPSPGMEPHLDPFSTIFKHGSQLKEFYLPTSPELSLKKMLTCGWTKLFEIKTCFRNDELGNLHQPEFQMLEWYRAYSDLETIIDDIRGLLGQYVSLKEVVETTMAELFQKHLEFLLTPTTTKTELVQLCQSQNLNYRPDDDWNDLFYLVFLEKIEPYLNGDSPVILRDYPPSQAALARLTPEGWADRFELYWKGFELANAFHELNDPKEQHRRFLQEIDEKKRLGKKVVPIDKEFLQALAHGMPPSAGVALGLDRLFMALYGIKDIRKTRAFPI